MRITIAVAAKVFVAFALTSFIASLQVQSSPAHANDESRSPHTSRRVDGSPLYWTLVHPARVNDERRGLLLLAQGSGCDPGIDNPRLLSARAIAPTFTALVVEKYGVLPGQKPHDPMADCTPAYFAHHTVTQRAVDAAQVLGELRGASWWDGTLVLVGGSEGGAVVARLAPRVHAHAVIVFSSGLGEPLTTSLRRILPPPAIEEFEAGLRQARANPASGALIGGNSSLWWADVGDAVLARELLKSKAPVLLIHGARDSYSPVESARSTAAIYASAGRPLTYWEYEGYDHFMTDAHGINHRGEVFARAHDWLNQALHSDRQLGSTPATP
jgi:pimeloyl-ACP methyl ester carboxylesterase